MAASRQGHQSQAAWQKMSKEELEIQYAPSKWVVRRGATEALETYARIGAQATAQARTTQRTEVDVPYGAREREKLDIYFPRDESEGTLDLMVDQVARSLVFLQQRFPDNKGLYVCGHSAGAHLAAMMLLVNWTKQRVTPNFRGFFLVSGIYDLEPIIHTSQNDLLSLTLEDARRNSPQQLLETAGPQPLAPSVQLLVVVGQNDSPEFHRQSWEFYQMLQRTGWTVSFQELPELDHFEIIWELVQDYKLIQMILKTIFQKS